MRRVRSRPENARVVTGGEDQGSRKSWAGRAEAEPEAAEPGVVSGRRDMSALLAMD